MGKLRRAEIVEELYEEYKQKIKSGVSKTDAIRSFDYLHPTMLSMLVSRIKLRRISSGEN